jgi:fatty-acyl-CoA synthase
MLLEAKLALKKSYWPADTSVPLLDTTLGDLLRRVAAEVPERIALVDGVPDLSSRSRWTYRELLISAERAAAALLQQFSPGERVAIMSPNSVEWILLQHGMSLAGLILVPLNPAYRESETEAILRGSGASGLIYIERFRDNDIAGMIANLRRNLPNLRQAIALSDWNGLLAVGADETPLPQITPGDLLQLQYTSGTTGVPKGACLHHHGVINTCRFVSQRAGFRDGGVWINPMPMFHIGGAGVSRIGTLSARGTFVTMPGFDPAVMLELIESERGTASLIVPTMILGLLNHPDFKRRDLSSMETVLTGAAAVPASLVHRTKSAFGCNLTILFGQTEVNGVASQTRVSDSVEDQSQTLGQPLPHAEVCIVDPGSGTIQPVETPGEICVRGYQNMHGYYGEEEATRETIKPDGWLLTGDLGIMDARGYLRIAGRLKDVIIRGGMNIYPREVEELLFDHPQIAQVSVIGLPDEKWGEVVAAIIRAADPENRPSPEGLYSYCRKQISAHKTPTVWVFVDQYPMTPTGKVQKFVLKEWVMTGVIKPVPWTKTEFNS